MITCPVCKRKFYKGKTSEFGRLSKHLWKEHSDYMKRKIKKGQRNSKKQTDLRQIDHEFMAIDDILLAKVLGEKQPQRSAYDPVHEQLGGLIIQALLPIAIEAITKGISKRVKKK